MESTDEYGKPIYNILEENFGISVESHQII